MAILLITDDLPGVFAASQQRSARTRDAFIRTGVEMLNEMRMADLKISALATRCGVSVGSFYTRFQDKEVYFRALISATVSGCDAIIDARLGEGKLARLQPGQGLDELVDLMTDLFSGPWRGVLREALLQILEPDDPWAPMRNSAQKVISHYHDAFAERFEPFDADETKIRLRFCFQLIVGSLQNELVNDYHVFSTGDHSLRRGLKEAVRGYMRIPAN